VVAGNTGTHTVKLVDAATGADVAGASVSVASASGTAGSFKYINLPSPVTLRANATYYLVTLETAGGDTWYDYDTHLITTAAGADIGAVWAFPGSPPSWNPGGGLGNGYGPANFLYLAGGTTPPPANAFVTSFTPTNVRQDFSGWVGGSVRVGGTDLSVTALGRLVVAGNTRTHTVKLVNAATGTDVASVSVDTAGAPAGSFKFANLAAPVTLHANTTYYLVTQESAGGDAWYDYDTHLVTTAVGADTGAVWAFAGTPSTWNPGGSPGNGFGPANFLYA
jgi:hypothetical protein